MIGLSADRVEKILCIGAHCDDIEIGAGGTILRAIEDNPNLEIRWVVFSSTDERKREGEASAKRFLEGAAKAEIVIERFRENYFPYIAEDVKAFMADLGRNFAPDLVLTHHREDLHQDHRLLAELTWNTFRDQLILAYEIPKWDGDLGAPNMFSAIPSELAAKKIEIMMSCFESQQGRDWFSEDLFRSMMRIRGMECRSPSGLAEGFYGRKTLLGDFG